MQYAQFFSHNASLPLRYLTMLRWDYCKSQYIHEVQTVLSQIGNCLKAQDLICITS